MEQEITQILSLDNQKKVDESFKTKGSLKKSKVAEMSQFESAGYHSIASPGEGHMSVTSYQMSNGKTGGLNLKEF